MGLGVGLRVRIGSRNTLADRQQLFQAGSGNSDGSTGQLEAGSLVVISVPAGDPSGLSRGQHAGNLVNGSSGQRSELLTASLAQSDGLSVAGRIGDDVENLTSGE